MNLLFVYFLPFSYADDFPYINIYSYTRLYNSKIQRLNFIFNEGGKTFHIYFFRIYYKEEEQPLKEVKKNTGSIFYNFALICLWCLLYLYNIPFLIN